MKRTALLITGALASLLQAKEASADVLWSSVASGCTPVDESIQNNVYGTGSGGSVVAFQSGVTGAIDLVCPLYYWTAHGNGSNLFATLRDGDGTGSTGRVVVKLYAYSLFGTGFITTLSTVDSNTSSTTTTQRMDSYFAHTFDFNTYMYWIGITISRTNSATTANTLVVGLTDLACGEC